jgi:2-dehydro-3-deoxyphosphogluconate aldolase / (4S)-4-hydroxy-2-oxoglutarate aldolase
MNPVDSARTVQETGLIAIVRGSFPTERLLKIAASLEEGGIDVLEVTLNSEGALEKIAALRAHAKDKMIVGAGTVRAVQDVDAALEAGAQFLVSPNFDPRVVERAQGAGLLHLPGVFTATEAQNAFVMGCSLVKLFPADAAGPGYLKALRAPLDDIGFIPTGGIDESNLTDYLQAGAVAVGLGGSLVKSPDQDLAELRETAARLVALVRRARRG